MAVPKLKEGDETSSRFEDNYLVRTLGRIATDAEIALTELVANAWDAGASLVDLTIPTARGQVLMVEDDGHGMTAEQFRDRWMKLGYDRLKHQSASVEFPAQRRGWHRQAYGHNGIGRHGLLCFADRYTVGTWRDGRGADFDIGTRSEGLPFRIDREQDSVREGHGTRLSVVVQRQLPDPCRIRACLAARFLRDPQFIVRVNGEAVALTEQERPIRSTILRSDDEVLAEAQVVDVTRFGESSGMRGIAFWVNGRLVGAPSWLVGEEAVIDGRGRFASRYAVSIRLSDGWVTAVDQDWWRFKPSARVDALHESVRDYVRMVFAQLSSALVDESSEEALVRNRDEFRELSPLGRAEVATFARDLMKTTPTVSQDVLSAAVLAAIKLEKSRGGAALLEKLGTLEESDIEGLNRLLSQWTVRDALSVLDEIDHRMALIAAIEKLSADPATDELQTLHPLVTQARWLFGPEFDSTEYASNVSLRTAAQTIFKKRLAPDAFINHRKRPDLVLLSDATCSIVGAEGFEPGDEALVRHRHVLIVELKRGRHVVGREDVSQAYNYVQDFYGCGAMDGPTLLTSFVVGHTVGARVGGELVLMDMGLPRGKVQAVTYGQLIRSAHRRLLRLKDRIPARYEDVSGADLSAKVMSATPTSSVTPAEQAC